MLGRIERVEDDAERAQLRRQGRSVRLRAFAAAALLTAATLFLR